MEFKGTIEFISPIKDGVSKSTGNAYQSAYVVITDGKEQYPNKVKIDLIGAKVAHLANVRVGQEVTAHFNVNVNEYNGAHYQGLSLWKFEFETAQQTAPAQQEHANPVEDAQIVEDGESTLPF